MRCVLVTGAKTPLARRLVDRLSAAPEVGKVHGIELSGKDVDHRTLVEFIAEHRVDTVVHCALTAERSGAAYEPSGGDVIGTMRLCATVGHESLPVRSLVLASSDSVYPACSHAPRLRREDSETEPDPDAPAATILEAEDYARDVAERMPHLNVAILRLAELSGPEIFSPLSSLLGRALVPAPLGFDPAVQLLHVEDAVRALSFAALSELAGVYNVASEGLVHWGEAIAGAGRTGFPFLPLEAGPFEPLLRRFELPHIPNGLLAALRFGRALDTAKLSASGCTPHFDQGACLEACAGP